VYLTQEESKFAVEFDTRGQVGFVNRKVVISEAPGGGDSGLRRYFDSIEKFMRGSVAERGTVFEHNECLRGHGTPRSRAIVIEHHGERLPKQFQVVSRETGFLREVGRDEAMAAIETVRDKVFPAHRLIGRVGIFRLSNGHARDGQIKRQNRIDATRETELHGPTDLAGVRAGGHDGSEGTNVVELLAHLRASVADLVAGCGFLLTVHIVTESGMSLLNGFVEHGTLLDEDLLAFQERVVADFSLEANIGDKSVHVLRIDARSVGGVRIAVGVAVFAVEEINEVVAGSEELAHVDGILELEL